MIVQTTAFEYPESTRIQDDNNMKIVQILGKLFIKYRENRPKCVVSSISKAILF